MMRHDSCMTQTERNNLVRFQIDHHETKYLRKSRADILANQNSHPRIISTHLLHDKKKLQSGRDKQRKKYKQCVRLDFGIAEMAALPTAPRAREECEVGGRGQLDFGDFYSKPLSWGEPEK